MRNPGHEDGYDHYHYWVIDDGILVRMRLTSVEMAYTLDTRDIQVTSQADQLFMPPEDYRKAGNRISCQEEKRKFGAPN